VTLGQRIQTIQAILQRISTIWPRGIAMKDALRTGEIVNYCLADLCASFPRDRSAFWLTGFYLAGSPGRTSKQPRPGPPDVPRISCAN
jgi:hypothetical protein